MSSDSMNGKCSDNKHCDYNNFKRAKYFHGMLMTDRDFTEEQRYHIEKRKLHNRMLHGWGVVCGLKMTAKDDNKSIIVDTGLALDCKGNEIFVCGKYEIKDFIKNIYTSAQSSDGECGSDITTENKWYVVIRYCEKATDPTLVHAAATSECTEKACDSSRTQEGFCFDICKEKDICCPERLPESSSICKGGKDEDIKKYFCEKLFLECPGECCNYPQVVLGSFTLKNDGTIIDKIDNWDCRKYVITFGLLQHWMSVLSPQKQIPFETIADYSFIRDACGGAKSPGEVFCNKKSDTTVIPDKKAPVIQGAPSAPAEQSAQIVQPQVVKKGKIEPGVKGAKGKVKGV